MKMMPELSLIPNSTHPDCVGENIELPIKSCIDEFFLLLWFFSLLEGMRRVRLFKKVEPNKVSASEECCL